MKILIRILINSIAVYVTARLIPGINIDSFTTAIVVSIVLGLLNTFIKPVLLILTLPVNILTLGLFTLVINAAIVIFASSVVPGFYIPTLLSALFFSIVLSIVSAFLGIFSH